MAPEEGPPPLPQERCLMSTLEMIFWGGLTAWGTFSISLAMLCAKSGSRQTREGDRLVAEADAQGAR